MASGRRIVLLLLLVTLIDNRPLLAQQRAETQGNQSPAVIAGRDAIVSYGLTPEEVKELTRAATAGAVGPLADKIVDLGTKLGVTRFSSSFDQVVNFDTCASRISDSIAPAVPACHSKMTTVEKRNLRDRAIRLAKR